MREYSAAHVGMTCLVVLIGVFGFLPPATASNLVFNQTVTNTDFAVFGQGGLRGNTSGSIVVSGISGTVTKALLVWHGPTATGNTSNGTLTFAGALTVGTLLGPSSDNNWSPFTESRAYIADVTALVPGNGTYALTNLANTANAAMNGASLLIFYNDGNAANNRDIVLFLGNDSNIPNAFDNLGWTATLNGINYSSGAATLRLIVSDGQTFSDNGLTLNAAPLLPAGQNWDGNTVPNMAGSSVGNGGLWDQTSYTVTSFLSVGVNNLTLRDTGGSSDALSLIAAIFDLPVGAAPPPAGPTAPVPTLSEWAIGLIALTLALLGAVRLRRRMH